jgi:hypothetical protein
MEAVDRDEGETYLRRKLKELYSSDQPRHACDGKSSDGRFQWTHSIFNFQLAATTEYETQELWKENCAHIEAWKNNSNRPKEAARIGLFFGAPGIGKTRTLLELKISYHAVVTTPISVSMAEPPISLARRNTRPSIK